MQDAVFRVDAAADIGLGHLMRCLALADALRANGGNASFVCRPLPANTRALVGSRGHEIFELDRCDAGGADDSRQTSEILRTRACGREIGADWLIVDHYGISAEWETSLRPHVGRIMTIDDIADRTHDCDLLLDQNLVSDMAQRHVGKVPETCALMLGPKWALLQREYADLHDSVPSRSGRIRNVLISFGGGRGGALAREIVAVLLDTVPEGIRVDIVLNAESVAADTIRSLLVGREQFRLHVSLPSLAPLMAQADLAIGAGGISNWERLCLGLPALVITVAENQRAGAEELQRRGLVRLLGHLGEFDPAILLRQLRELLEQELDVEWSLRCREVVDGRGAQRVATLLMLSARSSLVVRPATQADEAQLLEWANDPLTRKNAFDPRSIAPATHRQWLRQRLSESRDCRLYIVESQDGLALGQVRFQREGAHWEIHYSLSPLVRGRGLGQPLLAAALQAVLRQDDQEMHLVGHVKVDNAASARIFERLGFQARAAEQDGVMSYARTFAPGDPQLQNSAGPVRCV